MVKVYSIKGYGEALKILGMKKYLYFMKTKGFKVKKVDPMSSDEKDIKLIRKEIMRNPWYAYRNYLCDIFGPDTSPQDISVAHCMFNGINTWVESSHKIDISYNSILKALICLSLKDPSKEYLILLPSVARREEIKKRLYFLIDKLPESIRTSNLYDNISIQSSFDFMSLTYYVENFSGVIGLDLDEHRRVEKFFKAYIHYKRRNKLFVFGNAKFPRSSLTDNQISISDLSVNDKIYYNTDLYEFNARKLKNTLDGQFLVHEYSY